MNITDIFSQNRISSDISPDAIGGSPSSNSKTNQNIALTNQLKGMQSGDTLKGTLVAKDGSTVTISLGENKEFTARLDNTMNLEVGKPITLEVRSNGDSLVLSPLFQNTANTLTTTNALTMAGIPVNDRSMNLVNMMMKEGLPIGKNNLLSAYSALNNLNGSSISSVVDLQRLSLPLTQENIESYSRYQNLSYEIESGMEEVAIKVGDAILGLVDKDLETAGKVFSHVLDLASDIGNVDDFSNMETLRASENGNEDNSLISQIEQNPANEASDVLLEALKALEEAGQAKEAVLPNDDPASKALALLKAFQNNESEPFVDDKTLDDKGETQNIQATQDESSSKFTPGLNQIGSNLSPEAFQELKDSLVNLLKNEPSVNLNPMKEQANELNYPSDTGVNKELSNLFKDVKTILDTAINSKNYDTLKSILTNDKLQSSVFSALKATWSIKPEDVARKEQVDHLYQRLNSQLVSLEHVLNENGLKNSDAMQATSNMSHQLDFMNQLNQMYSFVQLPIRLSDDRNAHGDLYVYSNGKKLSSNDGKVSALLHLDMENLGPVDVYVTLDTNQGNKVNTQFTVADDETLDLINEHIDELTARLEKRGYSMTCKMHVKNDDSGDEDSSATTSGLGLNPFLQESSGVKLAHYSFDVRT